MSEPVYITELVKLNDQSDVVEATNRGFAVQPVYGGFSTYSDQYAFGNWVLKLSNGSQMIQNEEYVQALALSARALVNAGLIQLVPEATGPVKRFIEAFEAETVIQYVQPEYDPTEDVADIGISVRSPIRDELTGTIDANSTWIIIANEYASGHSVEAVRLSHFTEALNNAGIAFKLGARGIETV